MAACPPTWARAQHLSPALCAGPTDLPSEGRVTQAHQTPWGASASSMGWRTVHFPVPMQWYGQIASLCLSLPFRAPHCGPQGSLPEPSVSSYSCSSHTGLLAPLRMLQAPSCPRAFAQLQPLPEHPSPRYLHGSSCLSPEPSPYCSQASRTVPPGTHLALGHCVAKQGNKLVVSLKHEIMQRCDLPTPVSHLGTQQTPV